MGLPSNSPIRIPMRKRAGQPVDHRDHNAMVDAIRALTERGIPPFIPGRRAEIILPFQIYTRGSDLVGHAGIINADTHADEVESSPADGTWYFEAKVTINDTTGAITATDVQWSTSASTPTSTIFYRTLATVTVSSGVPDPTSIEQFNYGPLFAFAYGAVDSTWGLSIF